MYYYDICGWHTEEVLEGRETKEPPPKDIPAGCAANFTGYKWVIVPYVAPPPAEPTATAEEAAAKLVKVERQMLGAMADVLLGGDTAALQVLKDESTRLQALVDAS